MDETKDYTALVGEWLGTVLQVLYKALTSNREDGSPTFTAHVRDLVAGAILPIAQVGFPPKSALAGATEDGKGKVTTPVGVAFPQDSDGVAWIFSNPSSDPDMHARNILLGLLVLAAGKPAEETKADGSTKRAPFWKSTDPLLKDVGIERKSPDFFINERASMLLRVALDAAGPFPIASRVHVYATKKRPNRQIKATVLVAGRESTSFNVGSAAQASTLALLNSTDGTARWTFTIKVADLATEIGAACAAQNVDPETYKIVLDVPAPKGGADAEAEAAKKDAEAAMAEAKVHKARQEAHKASPVETVETPEIGAEIEIAS